MNGQPTLTVGDLAVHFPVRKARSWPWKPSPLLKAVDGVSFDLCEGETLGIVGESGCGKSTLARAIIGLVNVTHGEILWQGRNITELTGTAVRDIRNEIQMIFQDPLASLNPRMTVGDIISEPLRNYHPQLSGKEISGKVKAMMARVGLLPNVINRYPHEFSGGQCQRIGIARALILKPRLVICDEPVSALDVSIQSQVINLLKELQKEMGLSLIFIAHDLGVIRHISDRVLVMYLGNQVETAETTSLYKAPKHPYTRALLSAVPVPDPKRERDKEIQLLEGDLPSPISPPSGCVFRTRCPIAEDSCARCRPELEDLGGEHYVACQKAS
ncbi:MAG: murein tripeptide/oligopeptide ABC transporter ATP binding protein OppF [Endozoicomonas sp.]